MQPDRWDPPVPHRGDGARGGAGPAAQPLPGRQRDGGSRHRRPERSGPADGDGWEAFGWDEPTRPFAAHTPREDRSHDGPYDDRDVDDVVDDRYDDDVYDDEPPPPRRSRRAAGGGGRRRRGVGLALLAVVLLVGLVIAGGLYVFSSVFSTPDYDGDGRGDVIVEVQAGDTTTKIANELRDKDVVASVDAFTEAAADNDRIRSVQPGFYQLHKQMSGASAVTLLLDPASRVGQLEIRGGVQLDDTSAPDGTVAPGVLSLIAKASCATVDGNQTCLTVDDLRTTMATTDPAALGVPEWALEKVALADPNRRLEGLLVPGRYDVLPGMPAADVLRNLLASSSSKLQAAGLVSGAQAIGSSPYDVLTIASLVEKEAITPDMPKVARVIYNRLGAGQKLDLDSMVNYPLDLQALRTNADDRQRPGPYNSYLNTGLPPTPISAPGAEAIEAALAPEAGPWFYFVRCQTDGTSCFAVTLAEHLQNSDLARRNGAF